MWALRRSRASCERQREEDEKTSHHILQSSATAVEQEVSKDAIPRPARTGRTSSQLRINANAGKLYRF